MSRRCQAGPSVFGHPSAASPAVSPPGGLQHGHDSDGGAEGIIVAVNPAWTPVLGWAEADLLQRKIVDFVHPDDRALAIQRWQGPLPAEPAPPFQCSMRHKDGSYKVMSWTTLAVENRIFANGVEVTAEQEGTAHFDKSIQALYQLHRLATISQLTGGISHDFNNLLQNIVASLELVRRMINSGRGAETEKFIASAINSAQRAAALNQDLRSFSRPKPAEMLAVDMNELISGVSTMLGRSLPHAVKLDLQLSADLWKVRCDNIEAQTAILDLVLNACDAMLDGGIISIQTSNAVLKEGDIAASTAAIGKQFICIAVTDTGPRDE